MKVGQSETYFENSVDPKKAEEPKDADGNRLISKFKKDRHIDLRPILIPLHHLTPEMNLT